MSRNPLSRRDFLQRGSAVTLSAGLWRWNEAHADSTSPNEKLNIACIGTANRAEADIEGVQGEHIVALCDVDRDYLDRASKDITGVRRYADYREMLEAEAGKIDAVVIATADHQHAPAAIRAIRKGLHVYCEKPLTHTVQEARLIADAAREQGVATQMGTQIHAQDNYRRVVELVQAGTIGDISDVHVWVGKVWGGGDRPAEAQKPPASLNWELWLGPAPERPYAAGQYHPAQWRRWWDFGQGTLGDMACHYMDLPFWALNLRHPVRCETEGPPVNAETCPMGLVVRYEFPERDGRGPVRLTWYDGDRIPSEIAGQRVPQSGLMFIGSEGMLYADYGNYRLFPSEKFAGFKPPAPTIPASIGHHAEWIKACKEGTPTTCNFDYSGALSEAVLLGNVAYRCGQPLEWDAVNLKAVNCPAADRYLRKDYRPGWEMA